VADAQKRLSEMLDLTPDNVHILDSLAPTKLRLGKPEEAAEELEQGLAKVAAHLQSSVDLAKLKLTQKDLAGASKCCKTSSKQLRGRGRGSRAGPLLPVFREAGAGSSRSAPGFTDRSEQRAGPPDSGRDSVQFGAALETDPTLATTQGR